jgi:hypothetical protein
MLRSLCVVLLTGLLAVSLVSAAELTPALTPDVLDLPHCVGYDGNKAVAPASAEALAALLGIGDKPAAAWRIDPASGKARYFRVAFTTPVALGTIYTTFASGVASGARFQQGIGATVSYLKPGAPYPGDVTNDDLWIKCPTGALKTLPPGVVTRALRFSDRYQAPVEFASTFGATYLFKERYYSALNLGQSKIAGVTGKPEIWTGVWNTPLPVAGVLFHPLRTNNFAVDTFKPDIAEHPAIAPAASWKRQPDGVAGRVFSIYRFATPITTRAVRVTLGARSTTSAFATVLPLVNLGTEPDPPTLQLPAPPYKIKYGMPQDGFVALEISDKATGKRVRRLVAEVPRDKGDVLEPWDLKDDAGQQLPPGTYTWKAITRPPFKLTYEITVNNAGQPGWPVDPKLGGGQWLGDHSAPIGACAVGKLVFLGAPVSESGQSFIAVDPEGKKVWGEGALSLGFFGPQRIAGDGRCGYLIKEDFIQRIDAEKDFAAATIYNTRSPRGLPGAPITGAAARGDKLYIAYNAPPVSWLQPSFAPELLDPKRSLPMVFLKKGGCHRGGREDKNYGESEYDELMRFYATFQTGFLPDDCPSLAGTTLPSSKQAFFGDAPATGPLGGNLIAAFKKPITVASILVPSAGTQVFALKPDVKLPDDAATADLDPDAALGGGEDEGPFNDEDWIPLPITGRPGQPALAQAPAGGLKTQALRFKTTRLLYTLIMGRHFTDVAPQAERLFTEGAVNTKGGWSVARAADAPITPLNPVMMALAWKEPHTLRGVSLAGHSAFTTIAVDYWVGPANGDVKAALADDTMWKPGGTIAPIVFNGYFVQEPTLSSVDFGMLVTTRAVRIRFLEPEGYRHPPYGNYPVAPPHKAGFEAVVAYQSNGDDANQPQELNARVTEFQLPGTDDPKPQATILRHIPLARPGFLTFDPKGTLYAVSDDRVVTVPLDGGQPKIVVPREELYKPTEIDKGVQPSLYADYAAGNGMGRFTGIAIDADGKLFLGDRIAQVVKVFDLKTGKFERLLTEPGGPQLGTFHPRRLQNPAELTIDVNGKLWVAENCWQPKRVTRWSRDGKLEKEFYGPTQYGGGGQLDPGDRNVLNFDGMKFVIDWDKRTWKLDSIIANQALKGGIYAARPDRPFYFRGRRYLAGDPAGSGSYFSPPIPAIYWERNSVAVPLAAAGNLAAWGDVERYPDLRKAFGGIERERVGFLWWDKNGDGTPSVDEVQTTTQYNLKAGSDTKVGEDCSLNFGNLRFRPTGFTPAGAPMYDLAKVELTPGLMNDPLVNNSWTTEDGRTFVIRNKLLAADAKSVLWEYYDKWLGGNGYYAGGMGYNRPPGLLYAETKVIGHFRMKNAQGVEEEYFVNSSDQGDWFCYTGDGMLVGCIFGGPAGYGLRQWTVPEWIPGKTDLFDLRVGQEHYQGCVTTSSDGKLYAVAGHNHNSIVHVEGLEALTRLAGEVTVTRDDIAKAQAWELQKAASERLKLEPKVAKLPYVEHPPQANGSLDDWPEELFATIHDYWAHSLTSHDYIVHSQGALAYDEENLYIGAWMLNDSPVKNVAEDPALLFKFGFALDVCLGLDPKADPTRKGPVAGDLRLLISQIKKEPIAVLYRPVVPGAPVEKRKHYASPVGEIFIDEVSTLENVEIGIKSEADGQGSQRWVIEATIPWKSLGTTAPLVGTHLRGDLGILQADQNGVKTVNRLYWSGKTQTVVADIPSEARLTPAVWGDIFTCEPDAGMKFGPDEGGIEP